MGTKCISICRCMYNVYNLCMYFDACVLSIFLKVLCRLMLHNANTGKKLMSDS